MEYLDSYPYYEGDLTRYFVGSDEFNDETAATAGVGLGRRTTTLRGDVHGNAYNAQVRGLIFYALQAGKLGLADFPTTNKGSPVADRLFTQLTGRTRTE